MDIYRHLTIVALIAACVVVFAVERGHNEPFAEDFGAVPEYVGQAWSEIVHGEVSLSAVRQLSRVVTSIFVHGDVEHLAWNMLFLWAFGYLTSQVLGQWWALGAFFICGICGTVLELWLKAGADVSIIGASGAICGFEGLYLGLALRWQLPDADVWPLAYPIPPLQLGAFAVVGFLGDMFFLANHSEGIAYGAHAGGFLSGLAIAAIVSTVYPTLAAFQHRARR